MARIFSKPPPVYQAVPDAYLHWRVEDIPALLKFNAADALEELSSELQRQLAAMSGPWFQKVRFITLWGRQRHFTYFQSVLSDYWRGVAAPYLDREYARFCLSLPRAALDERRLQGEVFRRYFGKLAVIPGTYAEVPLILTGRFLVMRRAARSLPASLSRNLFRQLYPMELSLDGVSVRKNGRKALWPIGDTMSLLHDWLDTDLLESTLTDALGGNLYALRKLQPIQSLAFRLLSSAEGKN